MSVALDSATVDATINANTALNKTGHTVGTGTDRGGVAALVTQNAATLAAVVWDSGGTNQTLTLIGSIADSGNALKVWLFGGTALTSGAKTLRATWTGSSDACLSFISFTGVDQTGGATSFADFTSVHAAGSAAPSITIPSRAGDWNVGAAGNTTGSFNTVGQNSWYIDNNPNNFSAAANHVTGAATSVTLTMTPSVHSVYAGLRVVASSGTVTNKTRGFFAAAALRMPSPKRLILPRRTVVQVPCFLLAA